MERLEVEGKKSSMENGNELSFHSQSDYEDNADGMMELKKRPEECVEASLVKGKGNIVRDVRRMRNIKC